MTVYVCPDCKCRNTSTGRCIMCGRQLGSPRAAILTAAAASAAMAILWVVSWFVLEIEFPVAAAAFGGVVSGAMVYVSGGRGPLYQAIASAFTLAGLLAANGVIVWRLSRAAGYAPTLPTLAASLVNQDGVTLGCCAIGVMGGLWVWREDAGPA